MNRTVIVDAKRTAIGKVGGIFKHTPPEELGAAVIRALVTENALNPSEIDEVILGNAIGPGGNIARLTSLTAGLPIEVPGVTIDRQCGSGLEAINIACRLVQAGAGNIYIAGGVESSSLAPWKLAKPSNLYTSPTLFERARFSPEFIGDPDMGLAADNVAQAYHVTREDQDNFALQSHQKACIAQNEKRFKEEIVSLHGREADEGPRVNLNKKILNRLKPIFAEDGTVTAGNACAINDGASAILIMSEEKCLSLGLEPKLVFNEAMSAGVDPNFLGIGPIPAVKKVLTRANVTMDDVDVVEFNEAFASQVLASVRSLHIPLHKMNLGGGAIAFGHPYGASGAILVTRLVTEMMTGNNKLGLATLGIGGGLGLATLFERYDASD